MHYPFLFNQKKKVWFELFLLKFLCWVLTRVTMNMAFLKMVQQGGACKTRTRNVTADICKMREIKQLLSCSLQKESVLSISTNMDVQPLELLRQLIYFMLDTYFVVLFYGSHRKLKQKLDVQLVSPLNSLISLYDKCL